MSTPSFCAVCIEPRKGLEPHVRPGANGKLRTIYLCVDCAEMGELAELAQHDVNDGARGAGRTGPRDGNRQTRNR